MMDENGVEGELEVEGVCEALSAALVVDDMVGELDVLCTVLDVRGVLDVLIVDDEDAVAVDCTVEMKVRVMGPVKVMPSTITLEESTTLPREFVGVVLSGWRLQTVGARSACRWRL
jgi:hypothetical protein